MERRSRARDGARLIQKHAEYFSGHPEALAFRWKRVGMSTPDTLFALSALGRSFLSRRELKTLLHMAVRVVPGGYRRLRSSGCDIALALADAVRYLQCDLPMSWIRTSQRRCECEVRIMARPSHLAACARYGPRLTDGTTTRALLICRGDPTDSSGLAERLRITLSGLMMSCEVRLIAIARRQPSPDALAALGCVASWVPLAGRRILPHDYLLSLLGWRPRRLSAAAVRTKERNEVARERLVTSQPDLVWAFTDVALLSVPRSLLSRSIKVVDLVDFEDQRDVALARQVKQLRGVRSLLARVDHARSQTLRRMTETVDAAFPLERSRPPASREQPRACATQRLRPNRQCRR